MKHYLIGAFSKGKLAQTYFDSLPILGDSVEPIIVQYLNKDGEFDTVTIPDNVKLIKYKKLYPGNTGKHKDFREIVSPLLTDDAWCIFTDVHDVVFQAPLPDFPDTDALVAPEEKTFGEVDYWQALFPQRVHEWEVYNVGCFAMKRDVLREFWEYLYVNWMEFYSWYKTAMIPRIGNGDTFPFNIPFHDRVRIEMAVMFNAHYDTLCFNEFIRTPSDFKYAVVPELFGCYAYQVEKGSLECKEGQLYRQGKLVSIGHFNGSTDVNMKRKEA